jgi:hypothetical protein
MNRIIHRIDPANESTLRIRILLALNAKGADGEKSPAEINTRMQNSHGKKFNPVELEKALSELKRNHLVNEVAGKFKLTSDSRDQMEDLPNRCTKEQWDHILGLTTTGGYRSIRHPVHAQVVPPLRVQPSKR